MQPPVFPVHFVDNCCPKVSEARYWRKLYKVPDLTDEDDRAFAECGFIRAGNGMKCENCELFLRRPYTHHKIDEEFLPIIEEYYQQVGEYEKWLAEQEKIMLDAGAGI